MNMSSLVLFLSLSAAALFACHHSSLTEGMPTHFDHGSIVEQIMANWTLKGLLVGRSKLLYFFTVSSTLGTATATVVPLILFFCWCRHFFFSFLLDVFAATSRAVWVAHASQAAVLLVHRNVRYLAKNAAFVYPCFASLHRRLRLTSLRPFARV
jgi:hypothetical protein